MLIPELKEIILERSISFEKYCLGDLAWRKEDAISLIHNIMNHKIGILGGDVYILQSDELTAPGDNWYCEPNM